jgi:hypothetical protein
MQMFRHIKRTYFSGQEVEGPLEMINCQMTRDLELMPLMGLLANVPGFHRQ